jgi:hypothetical protein
MKAGGVDDHVGLVQRPAIRLDAARLEALDAVRDQGDVVALERVQDRIFRVDHDGAR